MILGMTFETKVDTDAERRDTYCRDADSKTQTKPVEAPGRHV
jgi:hypothetical protein